MQVTLNDPNLDKFINHHLDDIQAGKIHVVISQVKDYLFKIAPPYRASRELALFISHIRQLHKD